MLLIELTGGVRHLRFYPNTELDTVFLGITEKSLDTFRQLVLVDDPVTQRGVVRLTGIFVTKPTVVHHEELATHGGDVSHHLVHAFLVDVEIDTLPRVQQYLTLFVTMHQHVLTSPLMEVTGNTRESLLGESQCQLGSDECLTLLQVILRVILIDTSEEIVVLCIVRIYLQPVVA